MISILFNVADGMNSPHQHEPNVIIHRDLKSDNILIDSKLNAKLCDFGIAKIIETSMSKGRTMTVGTTQYKSPESFDGDCGSYSDVYGFGCVIYEMLSGKRPWDGLFDTQIMKKVCLDKVLLDFSLIRQDASCAC
jgi:serine/threonine protein kinase